MSHARPLSDLEHYSEVLRDVSAGNPVFLEENGQTRYAILDIEDYARMQETLWLMEAIAEDRKSGEEHGWLSLDAVEQNLGIAE